MRLLAIILLLLNVFPSAAFGKEDCSYSFTRLSIEEGLSNPTVNDIHIDERGIVWIGTKDGLNSFDGSRVKVFLPNSGKDNQEPGSSVGKIAGKGDGLLYLVLPNHLGIFDTRKEVFRSIPLKSISCLAVRDDVLVAAKNIIYRFCEDSGIFSEILKLDADMTVSAMAFSGDSLWLGTNRDGLYLSVDGGPAVKKIDAGKVADIYCDSKGGIWACTWTKGLYRIDAAGCVRNYRSTGKGSVSSDFVRTCCEDEHGDIFIGTIKGLDVLSASDGTIRHVSPGTNTKKALSNDSIWKIRRDRQGNMWVATYYGGVNRFNPEEEMFSVYTEAGMDSDGLSNHIIGRMYTDRNDNLWISTEAGVAYMDRHTGNFRRFGNSTSGGIALEHVKALFPDERNSFVWVGADMGGLFRLDTRTGRIKAFYHIPDDPSTIPGNRVRDIVPYGSDSLVVATQSGIGIFSTQTGICRRILEEKSFIKVVIDLTVDSLGNLWITESGAGLSRYNFTSGEFRYFSGNASPGQSVSGTFQDSRGRIWVSTFDNGLYLYLPESESFEHFSKEKQGFGSGCIYAVKEVPSSGLLILASGSGFSTFDPDTKRVHNFDSTSGLPFSSASENALCVTKDETVFLGSTQGMVSFKASDLSRTPRRFDITISDIQIDGHSQIPTEKIFLKKGAQASILLSETNYISFDQIQLECNIDGKVLAVPSSKRIDLQDLKVGKHRFRVYAAGTPEDICPPLEFEVAVEIRPFTLIYLSILISLAVAVVCLAAYRKRTPSPEMKKVDETPTKSQIILEKARSIVESHLDDCDFGIPEFCTEMGLSRTVLFQKIKEVSNMTPGEFILRIRLEKAAELLRQDSGLSIADVADRTGFRSSGYFSQKFKEVYNLTPLVYHKQEMKIEKAE